MVLNFLNSVANLCYCSPYIIIQYLHLQENCKAPLLPPSPLYHLKGQLLKKCFKVLSESAKILSLNNKGTKIETNVLFLDKVFIKIKKKKYIQSL